MLYILRIDSQKNGGCDDCFTQYTAPQKTTGGRYLHVKRDWGASMEDRGRGTRTRVDGTCNSNLGTKGRERTPVRHKLMLVYSLAYCLHRAQAERERGRVRASGRSGISVRVQWGMFGSQGHQCFIHSIRLFRLAVPPGRFCRFESIAPACQIRLRGMGGGFYIDQKTQVL